MAGKPSSALRQFGPIQMQSSMCHVHPFKPVWPGGGPEAAAIGHRGFLSGMVRSQFPTDTELRTHGKLAGARAWRLWGFSYSTIRNGCK